MINALELRDQAKQQLQKIKDVESGIEYLNKVKAIETWAKAEKKDAELQNMIAEQKIRTQRILGELIKQGQERGEIAEKGESKYNSLVSGGNKKTLSEIGLTAKQSHVFKQIAAIPEKNFESFIAEKKQAVDVAVSELTTAGLLKMAKINVREQNIEEQRRSIINITSKNTGTYDVVVIDPPWAYGRGYDPEGSRVANPYPEMSQDELLKLKIPFSKDCVLFLWTTHAFIWNAKELMDSWDFTYKATIVWDKEKIGMGAWLRMQCEFCLFGIKGKPIWSNTKWRDMIREPRREHSRKPEAFYKMVEETTAGRRLDYFARGKRKGWDVFGNDTERF